MSHPAREDSIRRPLVRAAVPAVLLCLAGGARAAGGFAVRLGRQQVEGK